ncbi:hypothetical protein [Spirillospora sp. NPDC047279]|uniref:hypothetical protein n=1 Tax=Spirillospora sp. NPDC047279 TaxID=3155478 RepID=UPI0033C090BB
MTDYRRFLAANVPAVELVLPYQGGPFVAAEDRLLRVDGTAEPGFWLFAVEGRRARPVAPADPPDLAHLPAVRGHYTSGYVVRAAGHAERPAFASVTGEPPRFAPVVARRWPSGALLPDRLDFESEAEEEARRAFEEHRPLGNLKGAPATLRAAYGHAVLQRTAAGRGVRIVPAEARPMVGVVADEGDPAAERAVQRIVAERARRIEAERTAAAGSAPASPVVPSAPRSASAPADPVERAGRALDRAGATLYDLRTIGGGLMEVRYEFLGERFLSVVHADTLRVADAGICLAGADDRLTLESLPGVIREAIDTRDLYLTAYP